MMMGRNVSAQSVGWKIPGKLHIVATVVLPSNLVMSSDNEFEETLEEIREEADNAEDPPLHSQLNTNQKVAIGVVVFIIGGLLGAGSNPDPAVGFMGIGFLFLIVAWVIITESGVAFRRVMSKEMAEAAEQQQQQTINTGKSNEKTRACQNCGWQNPKNNNYCHDCGNEL